MIEFLLPLSRNRWFMICHSIVTRLVNWMDCMGVKEGRCGRRGRRGGLGWGSLCWVVSGGGRARAIVHWRSLCLLCLQRVCNLWA